jgi:hypothetical protein
MMSQFEWFYQVGNIIQENGKRILTDLKLVSSPEEAAKLVIEGKSSFARRFRCDKKVGMVDEEWYRPETNSWI